MLLCMVCMILAFKTLRIRVGGTLQDRLIYNIGDGFKGNCNPFEAHKGLLFDFTEGCLYMERWDDLNNFFNNTGYAYLSFHSPPNTLVFIWLFYIYIYILSSSHYFYNKNIYNMQGHRNFWPKCSTG